MALVTQEQKWKQRALAAPEFIRKSGRCHLGFYGRRWDAPPQNPPEAIKLIDQASALRAFAVAASSK